MANSSTYYAHGKLLLTGEYAVLDGALALAVPSKFGQTLEVTPVSESCEIKWESIDVHEKVWFNATFSTSFEVVSTSNTEVAQKLQKILRALKELNPVFLTKSNGWSVKTKLEFDRHWGLGSSSTLIHLLSQWASVNPYTLLQRTFGGSGYDIACANANGPITYQKLASSPKAKTVAFNPVFKDQLFFVYLGAKQISSKEIESYSSMKINRSQFAEEISLLTERLITAENVTAFCTILEEHERLVSNTLNSPTVKKERFSTIEGTFKSLGAWGGDFVLFVGNSSELANIKALGYTTILNWEEMMY